MAVESLLRPQSAGSAILMSGSGIGTNNSDTIIFMKVASARFALSVGVQDVTGDGDKFTTIAHNNELRGQAQFNGFVLADHTIGIESWIVAHAATDVNPVIIKFKAGVGSAARVYNFDMVIKDVVIDWNRQAPVVGISVTGMITGESGGTDEFFDEATS